MSLLILPVSCLYRTGDAEGRAFFEIAGYELGSLPPGDAGNEISLLLRLTVCRMRLIAAVDRECERHDGYTALSLFQLGISRKPSAQNNFVKVEVCHDSFSFSI